jgi:DNA polymerase I-like protein with 3'-5' exonuclease and polymerase domains
MQKILIIGDRLSQDEVVLRTGPFTARYATWFRKELTKIGLEPIFVNAWEGNKITDFSASRIATVKARIRAEQAKLVLVLGFDTAKLLGLLAFVKQDRDQFDNLCNFLCDIDGVRYMALHHPREMMQQDHWPFYVKAGLARCASELAAGCPPLDTFPVDLNAAPSELERAAQDVGDVLCFDIETVYKTTKEKGKVVSIDNSVKSIAWRGSAGPTHVVSRDQWGDAFFEGIVTTLGKHISNPSIMKIGQNLFFDCYILHHYHAVLPRGPVLDTLHVANILRDFLPKSLNWLAKLYLRIPPWKGGHSAQGAELRLYNAQDVNYTWTIAQAMLQELRDRGLYDYWFNYRRDLFEATFDMATHGLRVDLARRDQLKTAALAGITEMEHRMDALVQGCIPPQEIKKTARDQGRDILVENLSHKFEWVAASKKLGRLATTKKDFDIWLLTQGVSKDKAKDYYYVRHDMPEFGFKKGEVRKKAHQAKLELRPREHFNPKSSQQKLAVLANMGIKLERTKKNEDKDTTEKGAIRKTLYKQSTSLTDTQRELLLTLLDHTDKSKMISTYYNMRLDADGRWRYSYNIEGAETGRSTSSASPLGTGSNSQNLPRKGKGGVNFKEVIIPSPGKVLVSKDQKSAESVVVAYLAGCKAMIEEFKKEDPDFHTLVAQLLHPKATGEDFNALDAAAKKAKRQAYKAVSHGSSYGLYEAMLQELLFLATDEFLPIGECRKLLDAWHASFPEVSKVWHAQTKQYLETGEEFVNVFGRKHRHGGIKSMNSLNELLAWSPQSTVPELTNIMLKWAYETSKERPEWGLQVLQMGHDALLVEIYPQFVVDYNEMFTRGADEIVLRFPTGETVIKWDCEVGPNWGTLNPLGKWVQDV